MPELPRNGRIRRCRKSGSAACRRRVTVLQAAELGSCMFLAIDIGNTNITLGLYNGEKLGPRWRLATGHEKMPDEYGLMITGLIRHSGMDPDDVRSAAIA